MNATTTRTALALGSYEKRFTDGPADPALRECTACRYLVESVDSHGSCDECAAERDAADEREAAAAAANGCDECGGCGVVRSQRMSNEAGCDLESCPACNGAGAPGANDSAERDAWSDALRDAAIEHQLAAEGELAAERALPHRSAA